MIINCSVRMCCILWEEGTHIKEKPRKIMQKGWVQVSWFITEITKNSKTKENNEILLGRSWKFMMVISSLYSMWNFSPHNCFHILIIFVWQVHICASYTQYKTVNLKWAYFIKTDGTQWMISNSNIWTVPDYVIVWYPEY